MNLIEILFRLQLPSSIFFTFYVLSHCIR
jgi:hypothetical protein